MLPAVDDFDDHRAEQRRGKDDRARYGMIPLLFFRAMVAGIVHHL